jgi:anti-anti-sigma factor
MNPREMVVVVTGEFSATTLARWGGVLAGAVEVRPDRLVVDLTDCPRVDAAGIAALLRAHREMIRGDGRLLLRGAGPGVRRNLELSRVAHVLAAEAPVAATAPAAGR